MTTAPSGCAPLLRPRALLALALIAAAAAYVPSLHGPFLFDDEGAIGSPSFAPNRPSHSPALGLGALVLSRPLTSATYAFQRSTTGLDPFPFHVLNVAIHLCASLLAFFLARATFRRARHPRATALGIFVSGVFALHPLQSQAVSYLSQRAESLSAALAIAALLFLLRAESRAGLRAATANAVFGTAALIAAIAAKPVAVVVPLVYVLHASVISLATPLRRAPFEVYPA